MITNELSLYQKSSDFLWTDEHIAKQMLHYHLDTTNNAASRNAVNITSTIKWLNSEILPGSSIIDLGCGPGLYTEHLAKDGYKVTGIDISSNSIKFAKKSAIQQQLSINYINGNYLESIDGCFDAAICIFCDFGALIPVEQEKFLKNVHNVLKKGGIFIFDVFSKKSLQKISSRTINSKFWYYSDTSDFFSPIPHYVLSEKKFFPEESACGSRDIVLDSNSHKVKDFITWDTFYDEQSISTLLSNYGFKVEKTNDSILCNEKKDEETVMFIKAKVI